MYIGGEKMKNIEECKIKRILGWILADEFGPEQAEQLMKIKPGLFNKKKFPKNGNEALTMLKNPKSYGMDLVNSNRQNTLCTIQDLLDIIAKKETYCYKPGELPGTYLNQMAEIQDLRVPDESDEENILESLMEVIP
jgi:hypothetical protein